MNRKNRNLNIHKEQFTRDRGGFTLIELMTVVAIIFVMAGIILGLRSGIEERARRARAEAEMAAISLALEQFRKAHGDYPWVDPSESGAAQVYACLIGNRSVTGAYKMSASARILVLRSNGDPLVNRKGLHFIEIDNFAIGERTTSDEHLDKWEIVEPEANLPVTLDNKFEDHVLLDPWGNPYHYAYREAAPGAGWKNWKAGGYLLVSYGPDGIPGEDLEIESLQSGGGVFDKDQSDVEGGEDNLIFGL